jgi:hypothetical protein
MLQAARQIRLNSRRDQDAVLLQCTVLGETAKRVSSEFRNAHLRSLGEKSWASGMLWSITIFRLTFTGHGRLRAVTFLN